MLGEHGCTIYEHRPRTCRTYDCRVFPAAGLDVAVDDPTKLPIARRARRWRFDHPDERDRVEHEAVRAAARYVAEHRPEATTTEQAVLAVELHRDRDRQHPRNSPPSP
jgi:hypothetical protein